MTSRIVSLTVTGSLGLTGGPRRTRDTWRWHTGSPQQRQHGHWSALRSCHKPEATTC